MKILYYILILVLTLLLCLSVYLLFQVKNAELAGFALLIIGGILFILSSCGLLYGILTRKNPKNFIIIFSILFLALLVNVITVVIVQIIY